MRAPGAAGLAVARNAPYAGGHIVERHGRPADGLHALQIEIDRSLYLDAAGDEPVAVELARTAAMLRAVIRALAEAALAVPSAIAAE